MGTGLAGSQLGQPGHDSGVEASAGTRRGHPPLDVAAEAVELPVEAHAAVTEDVEASMRRRRRRSPGARHHELVAPQLEGAGLQAQQLRQRQQGQLAVARPQAAQLPRRDGGQARPGRRARHPRHAPCAAVHTAWGARLRCQVPAGQRRFAGPARRKRAPSRTALLSSRGAAARPSGAPGTTPGRARVVLEFGKLSAGRACSPPRVTHPPRVRSSTPGAGPAPAWPTRPGVGWQQSAAERSIHPLSTPRTSAGRWKRAWPSPGSPRVSLPGV